MMIDVQVKPLEWEQVSDRCVDADGMGKLYRVIARHDGTAHLRHNQYDRPGTEYPSPEAAKAAAQADYEARIRSALVPAPAVPDDVVGLRGRLQKMHRRAQAAEGKLARMTWWFEGILANHHPLEYWWLHKYAKAGLRGASVRGGTAWDMLYSIFHKDHSAALEAQAAELARLKEENALMAASLDEEERKHGLSTNGNMWRFWSQQLREYHERRAKERDAHTAAQPAPDAVADVSSEPCIICGSPHMTRGEMTLPDGRWVCSRPCELAAEAVRKAKDATEFRNLATGSRP